MEQKKQLTALSEEELGKVTGGVETIGGDCKGPHQYEFHDMCYCENGYHYIGGGVCAQNKA